MLRNRRSLGGRVLGGVATGVSESTRRQAWTDEALTLFLPSQVKEACLVQYHYRWYCGGELCAIAGQATVPTPTPRLVGMSQRNPEHMRVMAPP